LQERKVVDLNDPAIVFEHQQTERKESVYRGNLLQDTYEVQIDKVTDKTLHVVQKDRKYKYGLLASSNTYHFTLDITDPPLQKVPHSVQTI
jgi:hypothetical protein